MHVVLDEPKHGQDVQLSRVHFRGWVWIGDAQRLIRAVEVWNEHALLGAIEALHERPDVAANLGLAAATKIGFDLHVEVGSTAVSGDHEFCLRILTTSGSRMRPFCQTRIKMRVPQGLPSDRSENVRVTLDQPVPLQAIAPSGFIVSGWVWVPAIQDRDAVESVHAWCDTTELGGGDSLFPRPDVADALGLPRDHRLGFEFRARVPHDLAEFRFSVRFKLRNGTDIGPFCTTELRVTSDLVAALESKTEELAAAHRVVSRLQAQVEEFRVELDQLKNPVPPDHLQKRQTGTVVGPLFYSLGAAISTDITKAFETAGMNLKAVRRILDFGCGCGRVLCGIKDTLESSASEVWGSDIDAEAIAWNRAHLGRYAQFVVNNIKPPLPFPEHYFDAIYSVSVFTHLPEEMQFEWLEELRRVVMPGGVIVASVHGPRYWKNIHPEVARKVSEYGFDYRSAEPTEGLPDFYMVAFHSAEYIQEKWGKYFDVIAMLDQAINSGHDAVILRRRAV